MKLCSPDAGLPAEHRIHSTEKGAMTRHSGDLPSVSEVCAHVKHLGYAPLTYIRLYGDEFAVVLDLLPQANRPRRGIGSMSLDSHVARRAVTLQLSGARL
jgi:predicted signal transduction protein with EAL and GGDEF domain